ncbi:MAG TPA: helicase, partial [Beijerinckiaceae bacterium]|nr:helicase [Beijerinckiaceae bacterium]
VARQVEDKLSDALHERLASRFVDRRTSVLMRRLRENAMLEAEVTATGDVTVEGQHVGHLHGFHFVPDPQTEGAEAKAALRNAAQKALASEIEARAERFSAAADASLVLSNDGTIRWTGDPVAKLEPGDKLFEPRLRLVADEQLTGPARDKVEGRLKAWLKAHIVRLLGPLLQLEDSPTVTGIARGIAFQIAETLGVLERSRVLQEVRGLDQDGRAALRQLGVRFGAYHLYLPALLKPAPRTLAAQLWALKNGGLEQKGIEEIAHLAGSGRTSIPVDPDIAKGLYRAAGFRVCGGRAVRVDILERLADLIRPAIAYRPGITPGAPPPGAADDETFVPTVSMTSLVGCSGEDFASILKSLGYVMDRRPGPAITVPLAAAPSPPQALAPAPDGGDATAAAGDGQPADTAPAATGESAATPEIGDPAVTAPAGLDGLADGLAAALGSGAEEGAVEAGIAPIAPSDIAEPAAAVAAAEADGPEGAAAVVAEGVAPVAPEAVAEANAEPAPIEVWRLHRRHHDGAQARHGRERSRRAEGAGRDARPRRERPDRPERRSGGPGGPHERRAEGPEPAKADATGTEARPPRGPRRSDERRGTQREGRGAEARRSNGQEPRRREERRDKPPDPNSPFAKLAALKAQLEGRDGDKR